MNAVNVTTIAIEAGIHKGDSTHHHDHVITPHSFKMIKANARRVVNSPHVSIFIFSSMIYDFVFLYSTIHQSGMYSVLFISALLAERKHVHNGGFRYGRYLIIGERALHDFIQFLYRIPETV